MLVGTGLFLLLLVMLFSIPISFRFVFDKNNSSVNTVELTWLFGWVKFQPKLRQEAAVSPPNKSNKPQKQESKKNGKSHFKLLFQKRFRQRVFSYFSDVWHAIAKEDIKFHMKIGLDDPADTGQLWAIVGPTSAALAQVQQLSMAIEPDFTEANFQLSGQGTIRVIPSQIIFITLKLLFSPALWQGLRQIRRED